MNGNDLQVLHAGGVDFESFLARHRKYVSSLATYFFRRIGGWAPRQEAGARSRVRSEWWRRQGAIVSSSLDLCDLEQIGSLELWLSVSEYRWRCPICPRAARSGSDFALHAAQRHGDSGLEPSPGILKYVHSRVGRAMDHAVRRDVRRNKFHGELPEYEEPAVPADQEMAAELALLVERARRELDPARQRVLAGMMVEEAAAQNGDARVRKELRRWTR